MALAASVFSLASNVRALCDAADPTKRTLHAFSAKMSALLPVVRGFDSAEGDSEECRSVMTTLRTELEGIRETVREAADMSRAMYYVKGRELRRDLTSGMRRMHFALMSLRLAESEAMRRRLADFCAEWLAMDVELFDGGRREREEKTALMRELEERIDEGQRLTMEDLEGLAGISSMEQLMEALGELISEREAHQDDEETISSNFFSCASTAASSANNTAASKEGDRALLEELIDALEAVSNSNGGNGTNWAGRDIVPRGGGNGRRSMRTMPALSEEGGDGGGGGGGEASGPSRRRPSDVRPPPPAPPEGGSPHSPGCRCTGCQIREARKLLDDRNRRGGACPVCRGGGGRCTCGGGGGNGGGRGVLPDPLAHFQRLAADKKNGGQRRGSGLGRQRHGNEPQAAAMDQPANGKVDLSSVLSMPQEFAGHQDDFSVFNPVFPSLDEDDDGDDAPVAEEKGTEETEESEDDDDDDYDEEDDYVTEEDSQEKDSHEEDSHEEDEDDEQDDRLIFRCRVIRRGDALNTPDMAPPHRGGRRTRSRSRSPSLSLARSRSGDRTAELAGGADTPAAPTFDEYLLRLPWDADVGDLKVRLTAACGVDVARLALHSAREVVVRGQSRRPDGRDSSSEEEEDRSDRDGEEEEEDNGGCDGGAAAPKAGADRRTTMELSAAPLADDRKSCLSLIEQVEGRDDDRSGRPREEALVVAFESSIRPRPEGAERPTTARRGRKNGVRNDDVRSREEEDDEAALECLRRYGDKEECRLYDSDPLPLARAMSRNLWPRAVHEFKIGLRVDAQDHRGHWAAGSVVEIVESTDDGSENEVEEDKTNPQSPRHSGGGANDEDDEEEGEGEGSDGPGSNGGSGDTQGDGQGDGQTEARHSESTRIRRHHNRSGSQAAAKTTAVRIHFDGSSRWRDKFYTIEDFTKHGRAGKKVGPLGSRTGLPAKPTEFMVYHRCHAFGKGGGGGSRGKGAEDGGGGGGAAAAAPASLFGQPFHLQFHGEWSTARAGAHILAQAARFVRTLPLPGGEGGGNGDEQDGGNGNGSGGGGNKALERARWALWQLVDELLDVDRKYMHAAVRGLGKGRRYAAAASFDAADLSSDLRKKLTALLPRLPFKVRVCRADVMLGQARGRSSKEVAFPFSLRRTVGNYMKDQHVIVLHWNKTGHSGDSVPEHRNVLYSAPSYVLHEEPKQKRVRPCANRRSVGRYGDEVDDETVGDDGSMTVWHMDPVAT